jgi:Tfp pilus assembly protein PilP
MKLTTGIVFLAMTAGTALGQNPTVINNTKVTLQAAQPSGSPAQKSGAPAARVSAKAAPKAKPVAARQKAQPKQQIAVENQKKPAEPKTDAPKQVNLSSRRDPFVSPVVNRSMIGSGCSTGKRCLAIDQINLKGVVKADSGMIAVVVNSLNKAYFLRENDPVFNGFVVKITGDSIIFKESVQDRLGKPSMREVTKKITTSAV